MLGLLGSIVAAVMLAPLRRLAILGGLAALAVIIAAQTLAWLAPYLLAVGLVLTAVGIVVLVVILRRRDRDAGQKGDALERVVRLYEWAKEQMPQVDREERRAIQASLVGPASAVVDATRARLGLKP